MQLCLLDVLELEVALGQTSVSLHLLKLEGVLALLFISSLLVLSTLLFLIDRLLQLDQILLLVLNTSLVLTFKIVELTYFVRYSGLALSFS